MPKPLPVAPPASPGRRAAALAAVPDPRRPLGWRPDRPPLPLVGLLQVAVAAMPCGARGVCAAAHWGRERVEDDPNALVPLGLPPGRSPSVATLRRVVKARDVAAFARVLGPWLAASGVAADDALARDGTTLRGIHGDAVPGVHLAAAFRPSPIGPGRSWSGPRRRSPARAGNWRRSRRCWGRRRSPGGS